MTQDEFVSTRTGDWNALDGMLRQVHGRGLRRLDAFEIARLAALYRALSGDIARAEGHGFGGDLTAFLERLAARAHSVLYAAPPWRIRAIWDFLASGFPRALRRNWRFFAVAALLFFAPMIIGAVGAIISPTFAQKALPASALAQAAESYGEAFGRGRSGGEGTMMTGFYVFNNVGIAFRCFATGIFYGLGSVFYLVYNGFVIGAVLGYVIQLGYGSNILSFVVGHSPFELTAIVISGTAGLRMGYALVRTNGETRLGSLRRQGAEILEIIMGAASMLLVAALIEGLWSGSAVPRIVKFVTGALLTGLVAVYLTTAGRNNGSRQPAS